MPERTWIPNPFAPWIRNGQEQYLGVWQGAEGDTSHGEGGWLAHSIDYSRPIQDNSITNVDVVSPARGVVTDVIPNGAIGGVGNAVTIRFTYVDYGYDQVYMSALHLSSIAVEKGQAVMPGQALGKIGGTGGWAPHVHVHFATGLNPDFGSDLLADSRVDPEPPVLVRGFEDHGGFPYGNFPLTAPSPFAHQYSSFSTTAGTLNGSNIYALKEVQGVEITGTTGNDTIIGTNVAEGYAANDYLAGRGGNNLLIGGNGATVYIYDYGEGRSVIRDSGGENDTIRIYGFGEVNSLADIQLSQNGDQFTLAFANGGALTIEGMDGIGQIEWLEIYGSDGNKINAGPHAGSYYLPELFGGFGVGGDGDGPVQGFHPLPPSVDPYTIDLGEPSPRRLWIASPSMDEDQGIGSVNLLLDGMQGALRDPVTVVWEVVDGTATNGQDFVLPQYGVTVMERSRTPIEFELIDNDVYDGTKSFQINILRSNAVIENASGTITILDDENPPNVFPGTTQPQPEEPTPAAATEGDDTIDVETGDTISALGGDDLIRVPSYDVLQSATIDGGSGYDRIVLTSSGAAIQLGSLALQNIDVLQIIGANTITMAASDIARISGASTLMIVDAWDDPITFDLEGQSYTETSDSWSTTYTVGGMNLITNDNTPMTIVNGAGADSPPTSATRQFEGTLNVTVAELDDGPIEGTGGWDELVVSGNEAVDLDTLDLIGVEVITFGGTGDVSVSWSTLIDHSTSMLLGVWDNQVLLDMEGRSFTDARAVDGWSRVIESGGRELIMNDSVLLSFADGNSVTADLTPVYGTSGNDTHTLSAGEHYFGGDGNDTVTTTLDVLLNAAVDGGGWWDGVRIEEINNSVIDFSVLSLKNIEFLEVHGSGNDVRISASDILDVTENGDLMLTHLYDDTLRIDAEGQEVAVEAGPDGWEQVIHVGTATITTEMTTTLVIENEAVA